MDPKKIFFEKQANTIIKKLESRKMEGFYCPDAASAVQKVLELIGDAEQEGKKTVAYGGSMTIDALGLKEEIRKAGHELVIREEAKTPEELKECKARQVNADTFLMSTNAITLDGELINIDARGNRVSFLIYGPDQVVVVAGMNKVVSNVEDGIRRVHDLATPPNAVRLNRDTPCARTGRCAGCLPNTLCCQTVVTRSSMIPGRIKVVLVGETLGY